MVRRLKDGPSSRLEAIAALRAGDVIAIPTDTVYGLAVDLSAKGAIEKLFVAKGRPRDRAIAILLSSSEQVDRLATWTEPGRALAAAFWPGGLTLIFHRRDDASVPVELTGPRPTIGLRVPDHAAPRALAEALGPLPTTSANLSGEPELGDADAIEARLGTALDLILDGGPARGGPPSTVVDVSGVDNRPRILRAGAIAPERIAEVLAEAGLPALADMGR